MAWCLTKRRDNFTFTLLSRNAYQHLLQIKFQAFWRWCDVVFKAIILEFDRRPSLLKALHFGDWFCFLLRVNGIWKNIYSVGPVGRSLWCEKRFFWTVRSHIFGVVSVCPSIWSFEVTLTYSFCDFSCLCLKYLALKLESPLTYHLQTTPTQLH
jgi:hypothetical protein